MGLKGEGLRHTDQNVGLMNKGPQTGNWQLDTGNSRRDSAEVGLRTAPGAHGTWLAAPQRRRWRAVHYNEPRDVAVEGGKVNDGRGLGDFAAMGGFRRWELQTGTWSLAAYGRAVADLKGRPRARPTRLQATVFGYWKLDTGHWKFAPRARLVRARLGGAPTSDSRVRKPSSSPRNCP